MFFDHIFRILYNYLAFARTVEALEIKENSKSGNFAIT